MEKVYHNAMLIELSEMELQVKSEFPIPVYYKNILVGDYIADLFVENCVIVEFKAVVQLHTKYEVQLENYLTATKVDIGLLINFGTSVTIKRKYRIYKKRSEEEE